jgi:DNA-binding response OmpR family regulator
MGDTARSDRGARLAITLTVYPAGPPEGRAVKRDAEQNAKPGRLEDYETFDLIILDPGGPQDDRRNAPPNRSTPVLVVKLPSGEARARRSQKRDNAATYQQVRALIPRVEALLRRTLSALAGLGDVHDLGPIRVDRQTTEVWRDGHRVPLSAREFQLLCYFIDHPNQTLSRQQLLREVWGYAASTSTRTLDVHVAGLRQKLERDPKRPRLIQTVRRLGYKFVSPARPSPEADVT